MPNSRHTNAKPAPFSRQVASAIVLYLLVFQSLLFVLPTRVAAAPPLLVSEDIVISQVYGGGGNSGATLKNDFIELFNRGTSTVTVTGWSVQYASSAGTTWQVTNITGSIPAGGYYLVQEAAGTGGTVSLPTPDATGTIAMSGTAGKVALVTSTTAMSGTTCGALCKDFVGFGSANAFEGSGPTGTLSNTTAAIRNGGGCTDTDNNASDFTVGPPTPRNSASALGTCTGPTNPSGTGSANPGSVTAGSASLLTVAVTSGTNPTSTGLAVSADLSSIGGSSTQQFYDDGTHGDATVGDHTFSFSVTVAGNTSGGPKTLPFTINDSQSRTGSGNISLTVQAPIGPADHLVISQVYGGGGNAGATFQNDYVELFNPTASPITVTGWSVQYSSATNTGAFSGKQALAGAIGPNEYYIVSLGSGGAVGLPIPRSNISNDTLNLSGTTGKVALSNSGDTLTGCPLADSHLVDLVGYGTANCSEGPTKAPAPSNTTAIFRKSGGAQDTNVNGDDFVTDTPNPRSTAPIPELGPSVLSTGTNGSSSSTAPKDASPTITFTEPVFVDPDWFDITCISSGQHNSVTMASSGGGRTWEITPNIGFTPGEQCTVTIKKDKVHDVDTNDSDPNTDTLSADYVWSFTVATGPDAPFPQSIHLIMGNPSNAVADTSQPNNYLLQRSGNALSYNRDKGTPNWVSWHLDPDWFGGLTRIDTFRPDPTVLPDWYRVTDFDYSFSGFDRGHMTPNADRNKAGSIPINQETYLMTNMVPQAPDNNQGPWADMENDLRDFTLPTTDANPDGDHELFIVSGPLGKGGSGDNGYVETIANGHVTVPAYTWKVVLVLPKGVRDPGQVTAADGSFAVLMPNTNEVKGHDWHEYLVSVRNVENLTSYNFFSNVPEAVQNSIENGIYGVSDNPPGTANQIIQGTEDTPAQFTLNAVNPVATPLTVTTSQPAHGSLNCAGINCTYTPISNYNGFDSFTFSVNNGTKTSNTSMVTVNIASVNDDPTVTNDQASPSSVQYSDAVQPVNFTAHDIETAAASLIPSTTFSKGAGPAQAGLPSGLSLTTQAATPGVWTLSGQIQEPAGSYTVNVTFADADGGTAVSQAVFNVNKEDASLAISGPAAVPVAVVGGTSGAFTFNAQVAEIADGAAGNIANAVPVMFQLTPVGSASPAYTCNASAITFPAGVPTASCDFTNIAVNIYDVTAIIGGAYYQGSNRSAVAVYDPSLGFVSGSGTISRTVGGETFPAEYSVVLKYKKDGTAQGSFVYTEHRATGDMRFASTSTGALAVVGTAAKMMGTGTLNALGNYSFIANFSDNGEPGTNDTIGLRITDSSGNVVADLTFDPVNLSSGNIQVH